MKLFAGLFLLGCCSLSLRASNDGSYISVKPFCARADGTQTCVAIVKVFDDSQTPLAGQSVTLISSRGASDVIAPANPQITDANGQVTFAIRSSVRGSSTLTAACNGQTISKGIVQDGAVGIWSFEGAAKDLSGKNNHGTLQGAPGFVTGKHGQALSLDGLSQYVTAPHNSSLNNRHAWSIDAWIYLDAIPTNRAVILQKSSSNNGDFYMSVSNKLVRTRSATRSGDDVVNDYAIETPDNVLATGKWQHLVGVWDGCDSDPVLDDGTLRIFVDGVEKKYYDISRYLVRNQSEPLNIGRDPAGGGFFRGKIDELKLYNRPLYPPEVQRSFTFSTTVDFTLDPPAGPSASAVQPECVRLSWPRSTNADLTSYRIYRSTSPGVAPVASNRWDEVPYTIGTCSDWGVDHGVRYYYVVTACSMTNESLASIEVSVVPVKAVSAPRWYGGDTHVHSIYSQDVMYHPPTELANEAKSRGFDWLFITDHNSIVSRHEIHTNSTPSFLGLAGEEVSLSTSGDNDHFNAFFIKQYVPGDGVETNLHDQVRAQGGFAMPNHCGYYTETTNINGLEVVRGGNMDWNAVNAWDFYLKQGFKIVGRGATDTHGDAGRVVMLAWLDRLSWKELYNAFKYGRTCAVTGPGIQCMLKVNGAMIGDTLSVEPNRPLTIGVTAQSDATITNVQLVKFGSVFWSTVPNATAVNRTCTDISGSANTYYRLMVQDSAGKTAVGGAVYLQYQPVVTAPPQITTNLPSQVALLTGKAYTYSIAASGPGPLRYQWYNSVNRLLNATNSIYPLTAGSPGSSTYKVVITNAYGAATSAVSTLTVLAQLADPYATAVLALRPVGYWPLQETNAPAPVTIETNYGTLGRLGDAYYAANGGSSPRFDFAQGGALTDSSDTNPAVQFSGPSGTNYLFVPRFTPALTMRPPLTFEAWLHSVSTAFCDILGQGGSGLNSPANSGNFAGIRMSYGGNLSGGPNLQVYAYTGSGGAYTSFGTPANSLSPDLWHHCVLTCEGAAAVLYVDGQALASGSVPNMAIDSWSPLTIGEGRWQAGPTRPFYGLLDEVAVYTNVLTPTQITNHYAAAITHGANYRQAILSSSPLLYYRMDAPDYCPPDPLSSPTAVNFGSAPVNATYPGGILPGGVPGPFILGLATNRAAPINGVISCVDAGNDPGFNPTNRQPFSAVLWFRAYPADARLQTLIGHGTNWALNLDGTTGRIAWNLGGAGNLTSTNLLNDGLWHMAAGVFDGTNSFLYTDGLLTISAPAATGLSGEPDANLFMGGNADFTAIGVNQRFFAGAIAHAALFTNALTAPQILRLYTVAVVPAIRLDPAGNSFVIAYSGTLLSATNAEGPYQPVPAACSPYPIPSTAARQFYRTRNP
jgi:hypothetical protein